MDPFTTEVVAALPHMERDECLSGERPDLKTIVKPLAEVASFGH